ncbi:sensor histidine kinase [Kribbella sp. NPDC004875]|uniref:sensor histidine kinase n=1 Tax=Kribbella sp. NPDC004875 TaxID=3364107 RepID=UPI0036C60FF4
MNPGRSDRILPALPYLFLLLPATFALIADWRPFLLGLVVATLLWTVALSTWSTWLYLAGMLAFLAALVHQDPLFSITGVGLFVQMFAMLHGWKAYAGVAATAAVIVLARPRGTDSVRDLLASFFVAVLIASVTGLLFAAISRQSEERRQLIERLRRLTDENAQLQADLLGSARLAGVLEERQRMAREIHDTIAQGLTGILMQVEAAQENRPAERLDTIRTLARDSLEEARRSINALRPEPLTAGLSAALSVALEQQVREWSARTAVVTTVSITGDPRPLHPEVEDTLLRVAQEALHNITKHADATRVGVTLSYLDDVVALDVRDDGTGFTPGTTEGFGLIAMRQRVTRLAGSFAVEAAPGAGTGISATVPAIPAPEHQAPEDRAPEDQARKDLVAEDREG